MLSQPQTTLNNPFFNALTPSLPHERLPYNHSTKQTKIHEYIASFIYPSSSSVNQPSHMVPNVMCKQLLKSEHNGNTLNSLSKALSDTVEILITCYETLLQTTEKLRKDREYIREFCLPREVLHLVKISQFERQLTDFLACLARMAIEHPQDFFYRLFYVSWSIVTNSSTQIPLTVSVSTQKLLNTILNSSMALEAELSVAYTKYCVITSKVLEDKDHILNRAMSKLLNRRCLLFDIIGFKPPANGWHGYGKIEAEGCKGSCFEDELENHEEYSTTSGSSRTTNDCNMKSVTATITVSNEAYQNVIYELYDGCFFGNLIIPFAPEDKLLIPEEEFQDKTTTYAMESSSYWEKDYYRYPKSYAYESPRKSNYTGYQPKHTEGSRKGGYYISYEPKQKEQEPIKELRTISPPLPSRDYAIPNTVNAMDFPDVTSSNTSEPVRQQNKAKTTLGQTSRLTLEIPKPSKHEERAHSGTSIREKSWESLSNVNEKYSKIPNSSLLPSSTNTSKSKNHDKVHYGKTETNKKKAPSSKKEDKGEFKLWDLINVKGKLKTG